MKELDTLNTQKGTATNAMCLFLAINTSGLALLPTGAVAIRALNGSADPWGICSPNIMRDGRRYLGSQVFRGSLCSGATVDTPTEASRVHTQGGRQGGLPRVGRARKKYHDNSRRLDFASLLSLCNVPARYTSSGINGRTRRHQSGSRSRGG